MERNSGTPEQDATYKLILFDLKLKKWANRLKTGVLYGDLRVGPDLLRVQSKQRRNAMLLDMGRMGIRGVGVKIIKPAQSE